MFEPIVGEKQCSQCSAIKAVTLFNLEDTIQGGRKSACKVCLSVKAKAAYRAKRDAGKHRSRKAAEVTTDWPMPTQTLTEALSCVKLLAWRGPVDAGQLRASL